jgi:hypothetical protein
MISIIIPVINEADTIVSLLDCISKKSSLKNNPNGLKILRITLSRPIIFSNDVLKVKTIATNKSAIKTVTPPQKPRV